MKQQAVRSLLRTLKQLERELKDERGSRYSLA
jgi:hypothetical protein